MLHRSALVGLLMTALLLAAISRAWPAVNYFSGLETGSAGNGDVVAVGVGGTIATDQANTGTYSLKGTANVNPGISTFVGTLNASTQFVRWYFRVHVTTAPSAQVVASARGAGGFFTASSTTGSQIRVVYNTDATVQLRLWNRTANLQVGTDQAISVDVWHLLEMKMVISATVGVLELKIDGAVGATGSNLNTGTTNVAKFECTGPPTTNSLSAQTWWDDVLANDAAYPGAGGSVLSIVKAGTPTYNSWTKSNGSTIDTCWNSLPTDATTFATGLVSTAQTAFIVGFSGIIAGGDTINGCKAAVEAKETTNGTTFVIRRRLNGVDTDTSKTLTSTTSYYDDGIWTDTIANINAMEIGGSVGIVEIPVIQDAYTMCDFTVGATPTPTATPTPAAFVGCGNNYKNGIQVQWATCPGTININMGDGKPEIIGRIVP